MTERADVVVIGGGATGTSAAFHLAELGITDVVVVEREILGAGSTSRAAGGIRLQFADELNVRIMLRSMSEFERFAERFGIDIGLHQPGYLFLLDDPADVERFRSAAALQRRLGVPTQELSVDDALTLVPQIHPAGLLGAVYCARDGYATPEAVVQGYAAAAAALGVRIEQSCAVTGIDVAHGRIAAVRTAKGTIATDTVICAAGVDSRAVGRLVGLDVPVSAEPHWLHYGPRDCGFPARMPLTIDFGTGFYMHREAGGLLVGGRESELTDLAATATARFPSLIALEIQTSWWGNYEMSPDSNAIVGEAAEPGRFLYATGFSGHGFQQCPAVGEHLAQLVAGAPPELDLAPLRLERFESAAPRTEAFVV